MMLPWLVVSFAAGFAIPVVVVSNSINRTR